MLIDKVKREDGKGYRCRYDKPKTPFQRLIDAHVLSPKDEAALNAYRESLTGIGLYNSVRKNLKRIKRIQDKYNQDKRNDTLSECTESASSNTTASQYTTID